LIKSIVIVGGGPVGLISAALMGLNGLHVTLLESKPKDFDHKDSKALALSNSSVFILSRLKIWRLLEHHATAIHEIHTSQKNSFGRTLLSSKDCEEDALGYIVSYADLINALKEKINTLSTVKILFNSEAKSLKEMNFEKSIEFTEKNATKSMLYSLLILADGGHSKIKGLKIVREEIKLDHAALVSHLETNKKHKGRAYERFTAEGPIALLPNKHDTYTVVWTGPEKNISELLKLDDEGLLKSIQANFGSRAGTFTKISNRKTFPLKSSRLVNINNSDVISIGNASQVIHPVAGQGLNVGIREAFTLSSFINDLPETPTKLNIAREFNAMRFNKSADIINITNHLATFFSNDLVGISELRGLTLTLLDCLSPLKRRFVKKMSYGE